MATSERHAVIVGINAYPTKPLQFAVADARSIAETLESPNTSPFATTTLLDQDATRKQILEAVSGLASAPASTKLLYLAGHAALLPTGTYFVPCDAEDWTGFVSLREVGETLLAGLAAADTLIIVADCCHAGGMEIDTSLSRADLREAMSADISSPNVVCLLACTPGSTARESVAYGHGVFTFHLVNALRGAAADVDGVVTAEAAHHYAARQMNLASHQRPVFRSRITGYVSLLRHTGLKTAETQRRERMLGEAEQLRAMLDEVESKLAELKPPFATRQAYRETGWQAASKLALPVAQKRTQLVIKWGNDLDDLPTWKVLASDVDALLAELANVSIGTHTEYGEIVKKLGEGGFGAVFRVQGANGVVRALKVFHGQELGNLAKQSRFRIGYRAMDQLAHPRIVHVEKFLECPLSFYMEFVDGDNLRRWYGSEQDPAEIIRLLLTIAQTVEYANGQGIRHRDIKPENVILYWDAQMARWESKLTDFDLAWFPAATSHTVEAFGAPFYAAPEQLSSPGEDAAHRETVDVYGLAMLAIYMVDGEDPIHVERAMQSLETKIASWNSPSAATEFTRTVREAGRQDVNTRLPTVGEFRRRLTRVRELLLSAANPNAAVPPSDFFLRAAAILGTDTKVAPDGSSATFVSSSGRTQYSAAWSHDNLVVQIQKQDQFMAEGASHADARRGLAKRIDALLQRLDPERRNSIQVTRHDVTGSRAFAPVLLKFRDMTCTLGGASMFAMVLGEVVAIYEQF